jgi:hypothetical protein
MSSVQISRGSTHMWMGSTELTLGRDRQMEKDSYDRARQGGARYGTLGQGKGEFDGADLKVIFADICIYATKLRSE